MPSVQPSKCAQDTQAIYQQPRNSPIMPAHGLGGYLLTPDKLGLGLSASMNTDTIALAPNAQRTIFQHRTQPIRGARKTSLPYRIEATACESKNQGLRCPLSFCRKGK